MMKPFYPLKCSSLLQRWWLAAMMGSCLCPLEVMSGSVPLELGPVGRGGGGLKAVSIQAFSNGGF